MSSTLSGVSIFLFSRIYCLLLVVILSQEIMETDCMERMCWTRLERKRNNNCANKFLVRALSDKSTLICSLLSQLLIQCFVTTSRPESHHLFPRNTALNPFVQFGVAPQLCLASLLNYYTRGMSLPRSKSLHRDPLSLPCSMHSLSPLLHTAWFCGLNGILIMQDVLFCLKTRALF